MLQSMTDVDQAATVISIDGVGAYDLISRNAMMEGLLNMEDGDQWNAVPPVLLQCHFGTVAPCQALAT